MVLPAIEAVDTSVASEIEQSLLAELRQRFDQGHNTPITLTIKADDEKFIAGLGGSTAYGWLLIKTLWVAPKWRGQGFGRALVMDAMKRAAALQCHGVWLDTSSRDARAFYVSLGFEEFGTLENQQTQQPLNHCRWFLRRQLY